MSKYIALFLLLSATNMTAQSLEQFRWENRLVVLVVRSADDPMLAKQLNILGTDSAGLAERKLKIIQLADQQIRYGVSNDIAWRKSDNHLYQQFKTADAPFEAILIGLDGGEKLRDQQPLTLERLFAIIDAMPMRRSELRRQ